ncbi:TniQ family protein [Paenibacillus glycanilyticus]|uniref:TniQ domain-containing protein n=1 Tax=Paenibacillus glycanilyticus TaxID=126569 RepID=A0ABQ6GL13_9BACL|nr:TniQ family protein [Paenibacillus glycanilyticus]GLX71427.1 hypothetical protein MU1_57770 [Paenibacillus glycanilyticus]
MVNDSLTIRPVPASGECLTSFLMRVASLNRCQLKDLWGDIHIGSIHGKRNNLMHKLDVNNSLTSFDNLSKLLKNNVTSNELSQLTFNSVFLKFYNEPHDNVERANVMIRPYINMKHRRVCPLCLEEKGYCKLIWQVNDISVCTEHHVKLIDSCKFCETKILYSDPILDTLTCNNPACKRLISDGATFINDKYFLEEQYFHIENWENLLNYEFILTRNYNDLDLERSLALKLLFVAQNQEATYRRSHVLGLSTNIVKSLISFIRSGRATKKVTLELVFNQINRLKISLEDFQKIDVPESYVSSVKIEEKLIVPQACKTPWCPTFNSPNFTMEAMYNRIEPRKKGKRYPYYFVCKECFLRYGYDPNSGEWQEIDGKIDLLSCIREFAQQGFTRCEIIKCIGLSIFQMSEYFGYLAFHNLLPDSIATKYTVQKIPDGLVNYFEALNYDLRTSPEDKYIKARNLFGWTLIQYSYYIAQKEVQLFYFHKKSTLKKPLRKFENLAKDLESVLTNMKKLDIKINFPSVAKALSCSESTLNVHGLSDIINCAKEEQNAIRLYREKEALRSKIEQYFKLTDNQTIKLGNVYKYLDRNRDYLVEKFPDLNKQLVDRVKQQNNRGRLDILTERTKDIRKVINELSQKRRSLNPSLVAKGLGIQYIHVSGYRSLKAQIIREIEEYYKQLLS